MIALSLVLSLSLSLSLSPASSSPIPPFSLFISFSPKCLTEFKTWYNGATGKELLLKTFRKIFAVYTAILSAFKEASGQ